MADVESGGFLRGPATSGGSGPLVVVGKNGAEIVPSWIIRGAGTPEGAVTAPVGSLYLRTDGGAATTLYIKESGAGNTGWRADAL